MSLSMLLFFQDILYLFEVISPEFVKKKDIGLTICFIFFFIYALIPNFPSPSNVIISSKFIKGRITKH